MYLIGVYLTGVHRIGVYITGVHLMDVHYGQSLLRAAKVQLACEYV
jgi:hypothetical protein